MATADGTDAYVDHPLLVDGIVEDRAYQRQLAETALTDHTLVCLPTGLGKTTVSLLVTAARLDAVGGKSLFLAPTKPLVTQHADFYRLALDVPDDEIAVFTGEVSPDDRADLWDSARVVVATPQVVENDLVGGRISLSDVTHLTFDECHRATGDYAYVYIAERYHADAAEPLVTGMSASPGGDAESIQTVCENLGIREVEVMTEEDADVGEYTHDTDVEWRHVELPEELREIRDSLNEVVKERLSDLKDLDVISTTQPDVSQKELNKVRGKLQQLIDQGKSEGYDGMSAHAEVMKLRRAVTLAETQSVESLRRYFERQRNAARSQGASKASQRFISDPRVRKAIRMAEDFDGRHPKFRAAHTLLAETLVSGGERIIVFTESRDTAETLTDFFGADFDTRRFVGQGDKDGSDGMTQTEQQAVLADFRAGEFEVLVSTSVAEEGLDVPEVDLVLFYEPVPTAIRSIQRKGRTGRQTEGRVVVLIAEDTRDEAYFWISKRREEEMHDELRALKGIAEEVEAALDDGQVSLGDFGEGGGGGGGGAGSSRGSGGGSGGGAGEDERAGRNVQPALSSFETAPGDDATQNGGDSAGESADDSTAESETDDQGADTEGSNSDGGTVAGAAADADGIAEIVVDQRELDSTIARDLSTREDVSVRLETLAVGDYVCSDRVVVERKSVEDFLDTLVGEDRSLFEQVGTMANHYARPVVVVEGGGLYEERNVHPNAIRGALASLAVDYDASVMHTDGPEDTADLLGVLAAREQTAGGRSVSVHGNKHARTLPEQQEYVVSSIADIGPVTARSLLTTLGSVEAVMCADREDLLSVEGVGEVTADRIREVVGSEYAED